MPARAYRTKSLDAPKPDTFTQMETILTQAHNAARLAVSMKGRENPNAMDCGFAWVVLRPGTHPLARHCRNALKSFDQHANTAAKRAANRRYGDKHWAGGWQWWEPGDFNGQAIGHHLAGAHAFRDVLLSWGINAEVGSRYD